MLNPYEAYRDLDVMAADPMRLVVLLYEGAIAQTHHIQLCIERGDLSARTAHVNKVTDILYELSSSLDHTRGGAISVQLARLYDYMLAKITDGNFRQVAEPFAEVETLLRTLCDAWSQAGSDISPIPDDAWPQAACAAQTNGGARVACTC